MDGLISSVGSFGRFQYAILFIIGLISGISSSLIYATVFIVGEPDIVCPTNINSTASTCEVWSSLVKELNNTFDHLNHAKKCSFDKKYDGTTIVTEWNLVCDQQYKAGFTVTMQIFGSILGFFGGGFFFIT